MYNYFKCLNNKIKILIRFYKLKKKNNILWVLTLVFIKPLNNIWIFELRNQSNTIYYKYNFLGKQKVPIFY